MVTLIPDTISPEVKSPAERELFKKFQNYLTSRKYVILHSLGMAEHPGKIFGEIDFVVLCNEGILCLEVKGGKVSRKDGRWTFTNRSGNPSDPKEEGPFEQVQGNMHSLRQYLEKRLESTDSPLVRCQYACAVLMPDCVLEAEGPDIIQDILFDARRSPWNLNAVAEGAFAYWGNRRLVTHEFKRLMGLTDEKIDHLVKEKFKGGRLADERLTDEESDRLKELLRDEVRQTPSLKADRPAKHEFKGGRLTDDDIDRLAVLLRGDFNCVPSLKVMVSRAEEELCTLTEKQYRYLESLADNPRTLMSGVAGSGKTLLAAEQARRAFWEGKDVLYLCYNHHIAEYLSAVFKKENADITAMTLHAFMKQACEAQWPPDPEDSWYTETLPRIFLEQAQVPDFDLVVIDEGQDLLKECYLPCLERLIRNGFEGGNWAIYYDSNQNIYGTAPELQAALASLQTRVTPASFKLDTNCRNTRQIADANILTSNICEQGRTTVSGPHAEYISYASREEEQKKINAIIRNLKDSGFSGEDFILLSKYRLENPKNGLGVKGLDPDLGTIKYKGQLWRAREDEIRFSTIFAFKGLEARIVILADVDSFSDEASKLLNYVAISRACTQIYVLYAEAAEDERQEMIASGAKHIVGA